MKPIFTFTILGTLLATAAFAADTIRVVLVTPQVKVSDTADLAIQLLDTKGQPITKARITSVKLDMDMGGMSMPVPVQQVASPKAGEYHFKAAIPHPGAWALSLTARVPEAPQPVDGKATFTAVP